MFIGDSMARSSAVSGASVAGSNQQVNRDQFLRLLVAQLENQDPLNPTADTEFLAQLAQFSSLEQLMDANEGLRTVAGNQIALNNLEAVSFLGREVTVPGDTFQIEEGFADSINFQLRDNASSVTVEIIDRTGNLVRTLDLGSQPAGGHSVPFDGRDQNGVALRDGTYRYRATAEAREGQPVGVVSGSIGVVTGVSIGPDGTAQLLLGERQVALREVIAVRDVPAPQELGAR